MTAVRTDGELLDEARAWAAADPDPADAVAVEALVADGDLATLRDWFAAPLAFGTAGLRGPVRPGPAGMNRAVVAKAAGALATHLGAAARPAGPAGPAAGAVYPPPVVVVGRDARHGSAAFAAETAAVLAGAGVTVRLLPPLPTPVLAFTTRRAAAAAGVMVTASHNPAADNGYKVYLPDAQLVPPADAALEALMHRPPPDARGAVPAELGPEALDAYVEAVLGCSLVGARGLRTAYTPLHGVGGAVLLRVLREAGFPASAVVATQAEPDPDFPTVAFPNPEEPGAMDAVLALGAATGAQLVLANDPDADRLAAAEDGRVLTGDEVGALLADHVLAHAPAGSLVATTIVSSRLLARIAAARGASYAETLTGFKWLVRAGSAAPAGAGPLVFAYEEALGYAVAPALVRDKDGISAALLLAERAAELRAGGSSLGARLDELAVEHGLHVTAQVSVRLERLAAVGEAMARLRAAPPGVGLAADLALPGGPLPPTDAVVLTRPDEVRVVVRPSGTEPKLKLYLEVVRAAGTDLAAQRRALRAELSAVAEEVRAVLGL